MIKKLLPPFFLGIICISLLTPQALPQEQEEGDYRSEIKGIFKKAKSRLAEMEKAREDDRRKEAVEEKIKVLADLESAFE